MLETRKTDTITVSSTSWSEVMLLCARKRSTGARTLMHVHVVRVVWFKKEAHPFQATAIEILNAVFCDAMLRAHALSDDARIKPSICNGGKLTASTVIEEK